MSTYYHLRCEECAEDGGFFSRQAWGWGNADIIENMVFLMQHSDCNNEYQSDTNFRIICESVKPENAINWARTLSDPESRSFDAFPRASEWKIAEDGNIREWWENEGRAKVVQSINDIYLADYSYYQKTKRERLAAIQAMKDLEVEAEKRVEACVATYGSHDYEIHPNRVTFGFMESEIKSEICHRCGAMTNGAIVY